MNDAWDAMTPDEQWKTLQTYVNAAEIVGLACGRLGRVGDANTRAFAARIKDELNQAAREGQDIVTPICEHISVVMDRMTMPNANVADMHAVLDEILERARIMVQDYDLKRGG